MTDTPGLTEQEYDERHDSAIIRPPGEAPKVWIRHDYTKTALLIQTLNDLCAVQDDRDDLDRKLGEMMSWLSRARNLLHEPCTACEVVRKAGEPKPLCAHCVERQLLSDSIERFQLKGGDQ